jgi:adenosine deaminase CECR1
MFRINLSPTASEACAIVDQIRFEEQQTLWTKEFEDSLVSQHVDVFPGMMFSLAKERMERSKLWKIVKRMPKGALLHCHLEAMVDLDWALGEAFTIDGVCLGSSEPLNSSQALLKANVSFTYSKTKANADVSIWSDQYVSNTPVPINAVADSFPDGGRKGFIEWIRSRVTITAKEHLAHHEGPNEVWRKFMSCFPILGSLIYYEPIYRKFVRKMCKQLLDDGVYYVDMRSAFYTPYRSAGQEDFDADYINMLDHMEDEIDQFKSSEEGKEFWGGRMIWTTIRAFDKRRVIESKSKASTGCTSHARNGLALNLSQA